MTAKANAQADLISIPLSTLVVDQATATVDGPRPILQQSQLGVLTISLLMIVVILLWCFLILSSSVEAEEVARTDLEPQSPTVGLFSVLGKVPKDWHYGAYLDVGYNMNFNQPENDRWRSKTTTFKVNQFRMNMIMGYIRKHATPQSRWGVEFRVQGGTDTEGLITEPPPEANEPISSADTLRHFSSANASYLFPLGNGLKLTAGLMDSFIGYESFHAKDNPNYTRGYLSDQAPYFQFGVAARYPVDETLALGLFMLNGYNYLTDTNNQFSYGFQSKWKAFPDLTFIQNLYYGPDQDNTDIQFWRFLSDSILEWESEPFLVAASYDVGTEKQADQHGNPRFVWMAAAVWTRWHIHGPWSLAVRPELYWDQNGLITGAEQLIQAITTTVEYKMPHMFSLTPVAKLEYRYDESTGSDGGFFKGEKNLLVSDQQQLILALTWAFDR